FGSKEGLFEAVARKEGARILVERAVPEGAGLSVALESLLKHYERDGDTIARFVAQEHLFEPIRQVVERGREVHRDWEEFAGVARANCRVERYLSHGPIIERAHRARERTWA
ncbi:MAG: hypothetical protein EA428_08265, partial [Spirochaetaceae bacterium]